MIASLEGVLREILGDGAVVDVGGVGYRVYMPIPVVAALPPSGTRVRVCTHLHVREDAMTLYGFETGEQRDLFVILLGVNGIGPKGALAALSTWTPDALRKAVASEDLDALTSIPGVGKKTAARIVLELREKLGLPEADGVPWDPARRAVIAEVKGALTNLGYSANEIRTALSEIGDDEGAVEELLRKALKGLSA
jgi:Holliday junction DNA helicase RuvA